MSHENVLEGPLNGLVNLAIVKLRRSQSACAACAALTWQMQDGGHYMLRARLATDEEAWIDRLRVQVTVLRVGLAPEVAERKSQRLQKLADRRRRRQCRKRSSRVQTLQPCRRICLGPREPPQCLRRISSACCQCTSPIL